MKRGILVAAGLPAIMILAALLICWARKPVQSHDWLRKEYGLDPGQAARVEKIESDYQGRCMAMCARIRSADARLSSLIRSSDAVTPEVREAIASADAVRTDCRGRMLEHFYEVAAVLPADKRQKYLSMVLPSVIHPEGMAVRLTAP